MATQHRVAHGLSGFGSGAPSGTPCKSREALGTFLNPWWQTFGCWREHLSSPGPSAHIPGQRVKRPRSTEAGPRAGGMWGCAGVTGGGRGRRPCGPGDGNRAGPRDQRGENHCLLTAVSREAGAQVSHAFLYLVQTVQRLKCSPRASLTPPCLFLLPRQKGLDEGLLSLLLCSAPRGLLTPPPAQTALARSPWP